MGRCEGVTSTQQDEIVRGLHFELSSLYIYIYINVYKQIK